MQCEPALGESPKVVWAAAAGLCIKLGSAPRFERRQRIEQGRWRVGQG